MIATAGSGERQAMTFPHDQNYTDILRKVTVSPARRIWNDPRPPMDEEDYAGTMGILRTGLVADRERLFLILPRKAQALGSGYRESDRAVRGIS